MSSTNKTTNLELSQFIGSDSPKWLSDYNADMGKIDTGYQTVKAQADATDLIVGGHTSSLSSLQSTVTEQGTAITGLRTDVTANTGSINTINSLIGNGEPTTTDKTIIGAINELAAEIQPSGGVSAASVSYDNTDSGLTASNVQAAIDELKDDIDAIPTTSSAANVSYTNTTSGLAATNVQAAIDEVDAKIDALTPSSYTLIATMTNTTPVTDLALDGKTIVAIGVDTTNNRSNMYYIPKGTLDLAFTDNPSRFNVVLDTSGFGITKVSTNSYTFTAWGSQMTIKVYTD